MGNWLIKNSEDFISKYASGTEEQILYRIISNRGIKTKEDLEKFLNPSLKYLYPSSELIDIDASFFVFNKALENKKRIRIVGDYDVDGIMSTYILYKFISRFTKNVDFVIPNRIEDGYGINLNIVEKANSDKIGLIITCDNGISAFDAIEKAKDFGIDVIILDHHEIKFKDGVEILPKADAVVDLKRKDSKYPFNGLCGAAVSYKFVDFAGTNLGLEEDEILREYLEFAAFATVCDVMDLIDENRIIVKNGLEFLNNTVNIGLKSLIKIAGIEDREIKPYHLGFILGPMLNASGRLDSAIKGLSLLLEENPKAADKKALELKELNQERSKLTIDGVEKVLNKINSSSIQNDDVLVIYEPEIHESIAGIIAGRIKDKFNKPTIVLTDSKDFIKGSARSIEEFDITTAISKEKDILNSFGGHKLAAGVSLKKENFEEFRRRLNKNSNLTEEDLERKIYLDLGLPISYVNFSLINEFSKIEPFGNKNPSPIFGAKEVKLKNLKIIGKNQNVLKCNVEQSNMTFEGISFVDLKTLEENFEKEGINLNTILKKGKSLISDIVYQPNINEWKGNKRIQLNIKDYRNLREVNPW